MDAINSSVELTRIIFLIGAVLALLYKKRLGVTPGGIIVPGTLAIILADNTIAFLASLVAALLCWFLYKFTFGRYALSGRWSTLANVTLSVIVSSLMMSAVAKIADIDDTTALLSLIAPGLISLSARKYGLWKVIQGTVLTTSATIAVGMLLALAVPTAVAMKLGTSLTHYQPLILEHPVLTLAISLTVSTMLYIKFRTRGAGYLIAPFVAAIIASSPVQGLMVAAGVALSFGIVKTVQKYTLIIGLERFVLSLFCAYLMVTTMDLVAAQTNIPGYLVSDLVLIIAIAVMTNDLCLQPLKQSLGKGISPAITISYITRLAV